MNYFLKQNERVVPGGSFNIDQINEKIRSGCLNSESLATSDLGESASQIENSPDGDWINLADVPGVMGVGKPIEPRSNGQPHNWILTLVILVIVALVLLLAFVAWIQHLGNLYV